VAVAASYYFKGAYFGFWGNKSLDKSLQSHKQTAALQIFLFGNAIVACCH
jgi:hypothetical protein